MKLIINDKGRIGYLIGEIGKPDSMNMSALQRWSSGNSMVITWLINSIKPKISKTYIVLLTTKEVWEAI